MTGRKEGRPGRLTRAREQVSISLATLQSPPVQTTIVDRVPVQEGHAAPVYFVTVIADAATLDALRKNRRIRPTDVLYRVPERDSYFY